MMGIPRSEFRTVLDATNVILGAGDPEMMGGKDVFTALFGAGSTLIGLMDELATERRKNPTDDLTSALVNAAVGEDMLTPEELGPFFILLAVAGNDTTRTAISLGMHLLAQNPDQRRIWQDDLDGVTPTAVEEIVRTASPVTFMRRTVTQPVTLSGEDFRRRTDDPVLRRRQPRPRRVRRPRDASTCAAIPTPTSASAVPDRTSASVPTSPAGSWR